MERAHEIWQVGKDERIDMMTANAQSFHKALDNDTAIFNDFLSHFASLFSTLFVQQNEGQKGSLRYITISFLKSSIVSESYEIATTCHTEDLFLDETETETYWRMDFLKDIINNDMERIIPRLKKEVSRIREYEIEEFRAFYALSYSTLLLTFFSRILHRIFDLPEFLAVRKEAQVDVAFGGYLEEAITLVKYGKEGI